MVNPAPAYHAQRRQYDSTRLLLALKAAYQFRVIAVTELDLFIPVLRYVFGEAEMNGAAAVFSLHRLREEFYGLPPNPELLLARALRELWHEVGHLFGLAHCRDAFCVMSSSHSVEKVDSKGEQFCPACLAALLENGAAGYLPFLRP